MARILLLGFVCVWFGAIVPGHQRGAVQLPRASSDCAMQACHSCCPQDRQSPEAPADPDAAKHCAICLFACMLDVPAADILPVPQERVEPRTSFPVARLIVLPPHFGDRAERAPPIV